jgi:hypothetical protein
MNRAVRMIAKVDWVRAGAAPAVLRDARSGKSGVLGCLGRSAGHLDSRDMLSSSWSGQEQLSPLSTQAATHFLTESLRGFEHQLISLALDRLGRAVLPSFGDGFRIVVTSNESLGWPSGL